MELVTLFRLVGVMNLILLLSGPYNILAREPYLYNFINKNINIVLYSNIYRPISLKLGMMIETTKLYILISVWMALTFVQGHNCMRNQNLGCLFSHSLQH